MSLKFQSLYNLVNVFNKLIENLLNIISFIFQIFDGSIKLKVWCS
jgi:hypothetical protein